MQPKLIHLPLDVAYDSDDLELTVTPPANALIGAVGVKVDKVASLYDHEVTAMEHGTHKAVGKHSFGGADYGVALGAIANYSGPSLLDGNQLPATRPFQPWIGRNNSIFDLTRLLAKQFRGEALSQRELQRALLGGGYPLHDFAVWPLDPDVQFKITAKRIYGATAITKASLVCILLDRSDGKPLCDGRADYNDRPYWHAQALSLVAAAGSVVQNERKWDGQALPNYGLRILQTFAAAYSNNGGTILYDDTYLPAVLARWLGGTQQSLVPSYADKRQQLTNFVTQALQEYDASKDLNLFLPWRSRLYVETETTATTYAKIVRLAHYGLLRQSNKLGELID